MKANNGELKFNQNQPVQLFLNGIQVGPKPQSIPIRCMTLQNDNYAPDNVPSNVTFDHSPVNPIFTEPERVDEEIPELQITLESYMAMVQQCRLEKIAHQVRSDAKHQNLSNIEVNRLFTENYVNDFSQVLQKQSMIPQALDENNPNLKVEIN